MRCRPRRSAAHAPTPAGCRRPPRRAPARADPGRPGRAASTTSSATPRSFAERLGSARSSASACVDVARSLTCTGPRRRETAPPAAATATSSRQVELAPAGDHRHDQDGLAGRAGRRREPHPEDLPRRQRSRLSRCTRGGHEQLGRLPESPSGGPRRCVRTARSRRSPARARSTTARVTSTSPPAARATTRAAWLTSLP